eukprot:1217139-Karenia_brevis.AAC.1
MGAFLTGLLPRSNYVAGYCTTRLTDPCSEFLSLNGTSPISSTKYKLARRVLGRIFPSRLRMKSLEQSTKSWAYLGLDSPVT